MIMKTFPQTIWLVRHGESIGNVARREAEINCAKMIESPCREPDVELSPLGHAQAENLGRWFAKEDTQPTIIYSSPYKRTLNTAEILIDSWGINPDSIRIKHDERLRERELGVFDCLTKTGAIEKFPELCDLRERWGKFYFRPPAGESWADVVVRLRSFIETELSRADGARVLIVTHEVVVRCFRYIIEELTEQRILEIDRASDVANGGITSYEKDPGLEKYLLKLDNFVVDQAS